MRCGWSRQVTHPNVCRVLTSAKWVGAVHYHGIVDGDLACLLRRIGRLPSRIKRCRSQADLRRAGGGTRPGRFAPRFEAANIMLDGRVRFGSRILEFPHGWMCGPMRPRERRRIWRRNNFCAASLHQERYLFAGIGTVRNFHGEAGVFGGVDAGICQAASRFFTDASIHGGKRHGPAGGAGDIAVSGKGPGASSGERAGGGGGIAGRRSAGGGARRGETAQPGNGRGGRAATGESQPPRR